MFYTLMERTRNIQKIQCFKYSSSAKSENSKNRPSSSDYSSNLNVIWIRRNSPLLDAEFPD